MAASYATTKPQKPGRTKVELNYRNFVKLFPEIASGEYRYLSMEAGEAMMPLHLEWIDTDVIAVSHTYTQNGDLMRDPEMTFRVDREKGTLEPLTFRQDGSIQIYQEVYPEPGKWIPKLHRDLNTFAQQWLKNISEQGYHKREAVLVRDGEDVRLTFDQDGRAVENDSLGDNPTVRQIYEHYTPIVKNMVLADTAYQNACANSDQDLARLEGNEAIKRAVLAINETPLLKQYYDNTAFRNRLHQEIISETYSTISQPQPEQAAKAPVSMDSPERFEVVQLWGNGPFGIYDNALERFYAEGTQTLQFVERGSAENYLANIHRITGRAVPLETSAEWVVTPVTLYETALKILDRAIGNSSLSQYLRDRDLDYNEAADTLNAEMPDLMEAARAYPDILAAFHSLPMFREWLVEDLMERRYQDVITDPRLAPERYADSPDAPDWARAVPAADRSEPEQAEAGAEIPPAPETVPEPTGVGAPEQPETPAAVQSEPNLTPNVDEYLDLKARYPDKLVGVRVGDYMLFYGKDAEAAAPAMGKDLLTRDIPGLGSTFVTGTSLGWQSALTDLLEHGHSVVLAQPDPERGPDAPYEIIKERSAAEFIPLGMELTMDGRRMKIDSVDFQAGTVSLLDLDMKGWFPIFRSEPIPFVREFIEEAQRSEEYTIAEVAAHRQRLEAADEIPVGTELTVDGQRVKIHSVDVEHDIVRLKILDSAYSYLQRSIQAVRDLVAKARTAILGADDSPPSPEPEPEQVEIDGGQVVPPPPPASRQPRRERHNFQITDDNLGVGGEKTKYQYNVAAIRTLKQIEAEGRLATPEEQETLA